MSTYNFKAIVLKSSDYKEHDKRLLLFTECSGVLPCVIKGVKKPKAKLKFAAEVFGFNEYQLVEKNGFYTVASASSIESLFNLTRDTDSFLAASAMLEVAQKTVGEAQASPQLFIKLLKAFKAILYSNKNPYLVAMLFTYNALTFAGYSSTPKEIAPFEFETLPDKVRNNPATYLKTALQTLEQKLDTKLIVMLSL